VVRWNNSETLSVHGDQLKPWIGDELQDSGVPMVYRNTDPHDDLPMKISVRRAH